jgi:hypothetical protein
MTQKQEISNTGIDKISKGWAELNELIEKINLLPKDWEKFMQDSGKLIKQWEAEIREAGAKDEILPPEFFSNYAKKFHNLIAPKLAEKMNRKPEEKDLLSAQFELRVLYDQNLALRNIINIFQQFKECNNPEGTGALNKPLQTIGFNPDTTLNLSGFEVIEILKRNNIPIERVRVCPICQDIFWAKRKESPACSDSHVIAVNTGKTRIRKNLEDFHKQREKLKKLDSKFSREHPLVLKQLELVKKLHNKIQEKVKKYGTL